MHDLEKKLEGTRQKVVAVEFALSVKDSELTAVQNNLKELEELREMKEVEMLFFKGFLLFLSHILTHIGLDI